MPTILCEIDDDPSSLDYGSLKKSYYYADAQVLAQREHTDPLNPDVYGQSFYVHDRLGSVRLVVAGVYDEPTDRWSVHAVNAYTYTPFGSDVEGECHVNVDNPFKFTGQWHDAEIDQYFLRARMYDPQMMRFTARDPVRGKYKEPMTLHRHLYCANDPINYVDLSGENFATVIFNNVLRRPLLAHSGHIYEGLIGAGGITGLEALAQIAGLAASYAQRMNDTGQFIRDMSWLFTERNETNPARGNGEGPILDFDDTDFAPRYRDGSGGQVRHFVGCLAAGYYYGRAGGRVAVVGNEILGTYSTADVLLGIVGVDMGVALDDNSILLGGMDDFIRGTLGQ